MTYAQLNYIFSVFTQERVDKLNAGQITLKQFEGSMAKMARWLEDQKQSPHYRQERPRVPSQDLLS